MGGTHFHERNFGIINIKAKIFRPHQTCFHIKVSLIKETSPSCFFTHFSNVVHVFLFDTGGGVKSSSLTPLTSSFFFTGVVSCFAILRNGFSMASWMAIFLALHHPLKMKSSSELMLIPFKSIDFDMGAQHNFQWSPPHRDHWKPYVFQPGHWFLCWGSTSKSMPRSQKLGFSMVSPPSGSLIFMLMPNMIFNGREWSLNKTCAWKSMVSFSKRPSIFEFSPKNYHQVHRF